MRSGNGAEIGSVPISSHFLTNDLVASAGVSVNTCRRFRTSSCVSRGISDLTGASSICSAATRCNIEDRRRPGATSAHLSAINLGGSDNPCCIRRRISADHCDVHTFNVRSCATTIASSQLSGVSNTRGRAHCTGKALYGCSTRLATEIGKSRQCECCQNSENNNDHDQFDQGEAALLFLHDYFLPDWLFKLEAEQISWHWWSRRHWRSRKQWCADR